MVITQKVTSLAFSIHDGLARKESELTKGQRQYAVRALPTPLEYFSYVLQFQTIMAGPVLFYNDYMAFIKGENLVYDPSSVSPRPCRTILVLAGPFFRRVPRTPRRKR